MAEFAIIEERTLVETWVATVEAESEEEAVRKFNENEYGDLDNSDTEVKERKIISIEKLSEEIVR